MKTLLVIIFLMSWIFFWLMILDNNIRDKFYKLIKRKKVKTFACGGVLPKIDKIITLERGGYEFMQRSFKENSIDINPKDIVIEDQDGNKMMLEEFQSRFTNPIYSHAIVMESHNEKELTEDEEMNALIDYKMQEITLNEAKDIING